MEQTLTDKNAIIYGGAGGMGRGIARTFAREGATVFLVGRTEAKLRRVAERITEAGGQAHLAVLDALDPEAVAAHLAGVVADHGHVDISVNLVSRGDVQGTPLLDMRPDDLLAPVVTGLRANFVTATAAARQMREQGTGGVILTVTSGSGYVQGSHQQPFHMGGTGPADAAIESFLRYLAGEVGEYGVRVLGIWTAGVAETFAVEDEDLADDTNLTRQSSGLTPEAIEAAMASMSMLKKGTHLAQVAEAMAFLASDRAAGITGTMVNVTTGLFAG
jgi:NAD(P)-dependent dehydrogenase (short-subunit alcohol dehydrogenase family)